MAQEPDNPCFSDTAQRLDGQSKPPAINNGLSVEMPLFRKNKPRLWFIQVEDRFVTAEITVDTTKFSHLVGVIHMEILDHVSDLKILLRSVAETYSDSVERQIRQLLTLIELGDSKPSHQLRRMRLLANSRVNNQFL